MDTIKQLSFSTIDLMKGIVNHDEQFSEKAFELLLLCFQYQKEF